MNVRYHLYHPNRDKSLIYAEIYINGKRIKISLPLSVQTNCWLRRDQQCSLVRDEKYVEDAIKINKALIRYATAIKEVYYNNLEKKFTPSANLFKDEVSRLINEVKDGQDSLVKYMSERIAKFKEKESYDPKTIRSYITCLNKLKEYEVDKKTILRFRDININFHDSFVDWINQQTYVVKKNEIASGEIIEERQKYSINYVGTLIKNIKKFMNESKNCLPPLHNFDGHNHPDFKTPSETADTVFLDESELKSIYKLKIDEDLIKQYHPDLTDDNIRKKIEALKLSRDRFLIGAYTMLRVSDYKRLDRRNFVNGYITIRPKKKTSEEKNEPVIIPMHPRIKKIIDKGFDFSKKVEEQHLNVHIKEIAKMAGINEEVEYARNEGGKLVSRTYKKYELITTHTARRSAATNMVLAGVPVPIIRRLGGWKTEKHFWKYVRMDASITAQQVADHEFFTGKKEKKKKKKIKED